MSFLLNSNRVNYLCGCKRWQPLCQLYFCRHCQGLRCNFCVCHEVDCHYCPNCLENMPSAEARLKKNKCSNCFDCPSCKHALSTRAASLLDGAAGSTFDESLGKEGQQGTGTSTRKVFYLICGFCRWSTREAGIPDQNLATGNWPEFENQNYNKLLNNVQENFRQLAAVEKAEKERKKFTKRRSQYPFVSDKYGLQNLLNKRRSGMGLSDKDSDQQKQLSSIEPSEETEPLPADIFTKPIKIQDYTTIEQRHQYPELQAEDYKKLLPIRKALSVKRSQRCKTCDHNLCKAEFNPSSIKFKMLMTAIHHVPEIRLLQPASILKGQKGTVLLTMTSLAPILTHVVLLPDMEGDVKNKVQAEIPLCEFSLPIKDDTADTDDPNEAKKYNFNDDKSVVIFRNGHKLGFKVDAKFDGEDSEPAFLIFGIKYDYVNLLNVVATGNQNKEAPEIVWLQQKVRVSLR